MGPCFTEERTRPEKGEEPRLLTKSGQGWGLHLAPYEPGGGRDASWWAVLWAGPLSMMSCVPCSPRRP